MRFAGLTRLTRFLACLIILSLLACDKAQLPQLVGPTAPLPRLPLSATLQFDETVQTARLEAEACGQPWQGHLGHALATGILTTSRQSFARVQSTGGSETEGEAGGIPSDLVIQLSLQDHAFERATAFGAEDNYTARLRVELMAVIADPQGQPIGKTPLRYDERLNIWTPALSGSSGACPTGQLEGAMNRAADELGRQLVSAVATWMAGTRVGAGQTVASAPSAPGPPSPGTASSLIVKASFLDENDNLILEGGEKIGLRIDATNIGQAPVSSAAVSLSGTNTLIDAFATATAGAMDIGPLQAGETKSTMFWGTLPKELGAQRGELVVSVVAGGAVTSQTLVAAMRPGPAGGLAADRASAAASSPTTAGSDHSARAERADRHAVLISLNTYREPWPEAAANKAGSLPQVVRILRTAAGLPREQMLVLTEDSATLRGVEESVLKWLPSKLTPKSVVLVYLSTRAVPDPQTGELFLIPFDGRPDAPRGRLISLHALQGTLKRIDARLCLLLLDAPLSGTRSPAKPDWRGVIEGADRRGVTRLVQVASSDPARRLDGLLVRALDGAADADGDGRVTVGELLDYLTASAEVYPSLPPSAPERAIPLTG